MTGLFFWGDTIWKGTIMMLAISLLLSYDCTRNAPDPVSQAARRAAARP